MTQDFERSIVRDKAHWITSFVYDPTSSKLVIALTDDPESSESTRFIVFADVDQLESEWTDRDNTRLEGLLGAHEEEIAGLVRYLLVTDQREIEVLSRMKVTISSGPTAY
jgi:hypothetical protein